MKYLRLELKICEGCGTLWFRKGTIDGAYCASCSRQLSNFPAARGMHPGGRPRTRGLVSVRTATHRCNGGVQ